jgi:hypothetical protein
MTSSDDAVTVASRSQVENGAARAAVRATGTAAVRVLAAALAAAALCACQNSQNSGATTTGNVAPPESTTFDSPLYDYSIVVPARWRLHAATRYADDPKSTDATATDSVHVPGTDTVLRFEGLGLGQQTYAAWARAFHRATLADPGVPSGCDGGAPTDWPSRPVGGAQGYLVQKCNEALEVVPVGRRVYLFVWSNKTFNEGDHYAESLFEKLLRGVELPDAATASKALWRQSS